MSTSKHSQTTAAGQHLTVQNHVGRLSVATEGAGFYDISARVEKWLKSLTVGDGLATIFIRHTSASLTIQENADTDVQRDLTDALDRLAPPNAGYRHDSEGPDDMPAHIKAMVTATSLSIPVMDGRLALGTWQGLYVIEHRARPLHRELALHYAGTTAND